MQGGQVNEGFWAQQQLPERMGMELVGWMKACSNGGRQEFQVRGIVEEKTGVFVGQPKGQSDQSGQKIKKNNGNQCFMGETMKGVFKAKLKD